MSRAVHKFPNRQSGLILINVNRSNPNGNPDNEGRPRTLDEFMGIGIISAVSFIRKIRDLIRDKDRPCWALLAEKLGLDPEHYYIYEDRDNDELVAKAKAEKRIWEMFVDARLRGLTHLPESEKGKKDGKSGDAKGNEKAKVRGAAKGGDGKDPAKERVTARGPLQLNPGESIRPVDVIEMSETKYRPTKDGNTGGYAPLGDKRVWHGLYAMSYHYDPNSIQPAALPFAEKDMEVFKALVPKAYTLTASKGRSDVTVVAAYHITHKSPLGSEADFRMHASLMPTTKLPPEKASRSLDDYSLIQVTNDFRKDFLKKFNVESIVDLCDRANHII